GGREGLLRRRLPAPQAVEGAALVLRRTSGARRAVGWRRLTESRWLGRCVVLEEHPRLNRRTTMVVQPDHFQQTVTTLRQRDPDHVTRPDGSRRLGGVVVDVHLAAFAGAGGLAARLEHACRPQPLVDGER